MYDTVELWHAWNQICLTDRSIFIGACSFRVHVFLGYEDFLKILEFCDLFTTRFSVWYSVPMSMDSGELKTDFYTHFEFLQLWKKLV